MLLYLDMAVAMPFASQLGCRLKAGSDEAARQCWFMVKVCCQTDGRGWGGGGTTAPEDDSSARNERIVHERVTIAVSACNGGSLCTSLVSKRTAIPGADFEVSCNTAVSCLRLAVPAPCCAVSYPSDGSRRPRYPALSADNSNQW